MSCRPGSCSCVTEWNWVSRFALWEVLWEWFFSLVSGAGLGGVASGSWLVHLWLTGEQSGAAYLPDVWEEDVCLPRESLCSQWYHVYWRLRSGCSLSLICVVNAFLYFSSMLHFKSSSAKTTPPSLQHHQSLNKTLIFSLLKVWTSRFSPILKFTDNLTKRRTYD